MFSICRAAVMLLIPCFMASATTVTIDFSGVITSSEIPGISTDSPFYGTWTYVTPGTPNSASGPLTNAYDLDGPGDSLTFNAGGYYFTTTVAVGEVTKGSGFDEFYTDITLCCDNMTNYPGQPNIGGMNAFFYGASGFLNSKDLPESWNLQYWDDDVADSMSFAIVEGSNTLYVGGTISSATISAVPEPDTLTFVISLIGVVAMFVGQRALSEQDADHLSTEEQPVD